MSRTRKTYYVNAKHTGRPPVATLGRDLTPDQKRGDDYQRITLAEARAMASQNYDNRPGGAGDAWANAAGRAVLSLAL